MNRNSVCAISMIAALFPFSQAAYSAPNCNYFSASIKVGKPFTKTRSPVKAITIHWSGVNVTINGNGHLVSTSIPSVYYYYDHKHKRYHSLMHNGHKVHLIYISSPKTTINGNIRRITRSPGNFITFVYNANTGYLRSISYMGNIMRFFYYSDGALKRISQPYPVKCVYATYSLPYADGREY